MYLDSSLFGDLKTYQSNFYNLSVKPSSYLDSPEFKCSVISSIGISLQPDFQNSSILYSSRSTLEDKNSSHLSLKELLCRLPQNLIDIIERKFNRFKTSVTFPANQAEINSKSTRGVKILMSQVFLDISSQNLISEYLGIKYDQETRPNKLKDFLCLRPEELSAQNNQIQRVLQHLSSMNFFNLTNLLNEEFKKYTSLHKLELTDEENTKLKKKIKELEIDLSCSSLTSSSSANEITSESRMQISSSSNDISSRAPYESYSSSSSSCSADPTPSLASSSSYHS